MKNRLPKFKQLQAPLVFGLIPVLIISINLLSACTQPPVRVRVIVPKEEFNAMDRLARQFEKNNKGIDIIINDDLDEINNTDDLRGLNIERFEKKQIEIFYMESIWLPEFVKEKRLMDLHDFPKKELDEIFYRDPNKKASLEEKEYVKKIEKEMYYGKDKKLYRIPFRFDVGVLFSNKEFLKSVEQVPKTNVQLFEISDDLKKNKGIEYTYVWPGMRYEGQVAVFLDVLYSFGGEWINVEKKEVGLDREEAKNAVNFLRETIIREVSSPHVLTYDEKKTSEDFSSNKIPFIRSWPAWYNKFTNSIGLKQQNTIAVTPVVRAENKQSVACRGGWGFGIASNTEHKNEALKVIEFFTSSAAQMKFTLEYGSLPSRRNLMAANEIMTKYPYFSIMPKILQSSKARPLLVDYETATGILQKYLDKALRADSKKEVNRLMDDAAKETRQKINFSKTPPPLDRLGN